MESYNQPDFSDRNTILYGHNMANGTMFADLHMFEDSDFSLSTKLLRYILLRVSRHIKCIQLMNMMIDI